MYSAKDHRCQYVITSLNTTQEHNYKKQIYKIQKKYPVFSVFILSRVHCVPFPTRVVIILNVIKNSGYHAQNSFLGYKTSIYSIHQKFLLRNYF